MNLAVATEQTGISYSVILSFNNEQTPEDARLSFSKIKYCTNAMIHFKLYALKAHVIVLYSANLSNATFTLCSP